VIYAAGTLFNNRPGFRLAKLPTIWALKL